MKYQIINSKKGQIFIMLLVIGVLVLTGYALFTFLTHQKSLGEIESPLLLSSMNNDMQRFLFFAEESARISLANAYNDIAKEDKFPASTCSYEGDYIKFCGIAGDLNQQIASKSQEYFQAMIKTYPEQQFSDIEFNAEFNDKTLTLKGEKTLHTGIQEGLFPYGAVYDFKPEIELSLEKINLDSFQDIRDAAQNCVNKPSEQEIQDCMKDLKFQLITGKETGGTIFSLASNDKFLIISQDGAEYKPIILDFLL